MALRRPFASLCTAQKVSFTVLAASTVSGVRPLAAKARSNSVAELQNQRAEAAEQRAEAAEQRAEAAEQRAEAAEKQAKSRIWAGTALCCVMLIIVAGVLTGYFPYIISRKLLPSVAEVIKQALHR